MQTGSEHLGELARTPSTSIDDGLAKLLGKAHALQALLSHILTSSVAPFLLHFIVDQAPNWFTFFFLYVNIFIHDIIHDIPT